MWGGIRQEEHLAAQRQNGEQPVWAMGYRHCESGNPPCGGSKEHTARCKQAYQLVVNSKFAT